MIAVIGDSRRQAASIGLHHALGFHHVGILEDVGFKHGRWLDSVLMQRSLGRAIRQNRNSPELHGLSPRCYERARFRFILQQK